MAEAPSPRNDATSSGNANFNPDHIILRIDNIEIAIPTTLCVCAARLLLTPFRQVCNFFEKTSMFIIIAKCMDYSI